MSKFCEVSPEAYLFVHVVQLLLWLLYVNNASCFCIHCAPVIALLSVLLLAPIFRFWCSPVLVKWHNKDFTCDFICLFHNFCCICSFLNLEPVQ